MDTIERVARAICVVEGGDPDRKITAVLPVRRGTGRGYVTPTQLAGAPTWRAYEREAVAALTALKDAGYVVVRVAELSDADIHKAKTSVSKAEEQGQ